MIKARLLRSASTRPTRPPRFFHGKPIRPPRPEQLATGLQGQSNSVVPSVIWGLVVAIVGLAWWWAFRRWRHPFSWAIGVVPFLIVLFPFYVFLERALPNGY